MAYCESLKAELLAQNYEGDRLRVKIDARDISGADKKWEWVNKGAPLLIEIGPANPEPFNIETESNPDVPRLAVMVPAARMNDSEAFPP